MMSFQDFQSNFDVLEMCHLGPESALETKTTSFASRRENGSWVRRTTAGGCRNYINTFWTNPQYRVNITDLDEDDDENCATALISLMQKDRRAQRKLSKQNLNIGFYIYKLPAGASKEPLDIDFFNQHASEHTSGFKEAREVCCRYKLTPGTYVIVPCTFEPQEEGNFLLRIFSENPMSIEELDEPNSQTRPAGREVLASSEVDKRVEEKLRATFVRIAGPDQEIDAWELQEILNSAYGSDFPMSRGFSIGKCKSIVAMLDNDMTGKLGVQEFQELWNDLRLWKGVYKKYDADRSGLMTSHELRNALGSCGFRISNGTFAAATMRHSNQKGDIEFPDFLLLMVQLSRATDLFNDFKTAQAKAQFSLDEFLKISIYN